MIESTNFIITICFYNSITILLEHTKKKYNGEFKQNYKKL